MDKKTYYVSVQSGSILPAEGDDAFEFEISATMEEYEKLQEQMAGKQDADDEAFNRAVIPAIPYHIDAENDVYDRQLQEVYQTIYELGTPETKKHINSMGVLNNIRF